jgi:hypothetical protein
MPLIVYRRLLPRAQQNGVRAPAPVHSVASRDPTTPRTYPSSLPLWQPGFPLSPPRWRSLHRRLSPAMGDSWASMVDIPLLPMFQESSSTNNNATGHGQTVDLAATKLYCGSGNVPRPDGLEKFRRSSRGHMLDNSGSSRHQQLRV